jgi:hypothetical protein
MAFIEPIPKPVKKPGCPVCASPHPATSVNTTAEMQGGELEPLFRQVYEKLCQPHKLSVLSVLGKKTNL